MTDGMGGPRGRSGKGKREEETNGGWVKAGGKRREVGKGKREKERKIEKEE